MTRKELKEGYRESNEIADTLLCSNGISKTKHFNKPMSLQGFYFIFEVALCYLVVDEK